MYSCIIVDDQTEAVNLIRDHVLKIPQLSIQLMTTDSIAALAFLDKSKPDIIFLDIEMPGITGIEFIRNIKAKWGNDIPKIVLTTGYTDYAVSGYEHGVADYLLKPITFSRFKMCTDRILSDLDMRSANTEKPTFFFAEDEGKKIKINFDDIVLIKGEGNYVDIFYAENKKLVYKSLTAMQELLPCDKFIRIHKSYIVAISKIQSLVSNEIIVKWKDKEFNVPVGSTFKDNVLKQLGIS